MFFLSTLQYHICKILIEVQFDFRNIFETPKCEVQFDLRNIFETPKCDY